MSQIDQSEDFKLPSDPNERQRLKSMIDEGVKADLMRISCNDKIKETCALIKEEFGLPSEYVRTIISSQTRDNFTKNRAKTESKLELADTYNSLMGKKGAQ